MKITQSPTRKPWWHGKTFECQVCGWAAEFEEGDQTKPGFSGGPNAATLMCRSCFGTITISNSPSPEVVPASPPATLPDPPPTVAPPSGFFGKKKGK
jgi:rubredoxin